MPVNLDSLKNRLATALANNRINSREAEGIVREAMRDGLAPEEAAFLRESLGLNLDKFTTVAADRFRKAFSSVDANPTPPPAPTPTPAPVTPARRDLDDPAVLKKHEGQVDYTWMQGSLFVNGVDATDVIQGQIANCYMVSAFSAVAEQHPEAITNAIKDNGDGTYTVRFFEQSYYGAAKQVEVTVDGELPGGVGSFKYAKGADRAELWVPILEKAFAQWKGSYDAIGNGGSPGMVMSALLGSREQYTGMYEGMSTDALFRQLQTAFASHKAVVAATHGEDQSALYSGTGLYAWHAYTVLGVSEENGQKYVQLRNPWGSSEPGNDGKNDGIFKLPVADFAKYYAGVWAN